MMLTRPVIWGIIRTRFPLGVLLIFGVKAKSNHCIAIDTPQWL